jgi:hypothetical protein
MSEGEIVSIGFVPKKGAIDIKNIKLIKVAFSYLRNVRSQVGRLVGCQIVEGDDAHQQHADSKQTDHVF